MITSLRLVNFKNFADETLRVGPFTVLVGENASGKSNIRDAFRFLHGIGRGYTLAEIFGGKHEAGWKPIRGATDEVIRFGQPSLSLCVKFRVENRRFNYAIKVRRDKTRLGTFRVAREELNADGRPIYTTQLNSLAHRDAICLRLGDTDNIIAVRPDQPALTQIQSYPLVIWHDQDYGNLVAQVIGVLANIRFLELSPEQMRVPAFPDATVLGDGGENLPTVLAEICIDPRQQEILAEWLAELTQMDVAGFEFLRDPSGRVHLMICEANGRKVSAYSASDGTLRFLAMLTALLGTNPSGIYFFEELDNGIHPNRLWLLLELIEKQTAKNGIQVITTTHSPDMLALINDKTFENTSVTCRLEDTDDAVIRSVASLPNAQKLRRSQGLGRLHTSGWLEDMLNLARAQDERIRE